MTTNTEALAAAIECSEPFTLIDKACNEAAAELRRLAAVEADYSRLLNDSQNVLAAQAEGWRKAEAERGALVAALRRVLDTHEREAKAYLTAQVASENFSRRSAKADEHAHLQAAMEASKAEKEARELLAKDHP